MTTYNFCAGPAMLPRSVMRQVHEEFLDYHGIGASVIEIGHRSPAFREVMESAIGLFRKLTELPDDYHVLFVHGGARMQFSAVPLNLLDRSPTRTCGVVETGLFARQAWEEAARYGTAVVLASSADTDYDRIPPVSPEQCPADAAYVHLTSNNTVYGTRWHTFPTDLPAPIVIDATSEILSRRIDYSRFGITFAGFQKNLGPSSLALVLVRDDLLGRALPGTPLLLDYSVYVRSESMHNTPNTFAIYVMGLMMRWVEEQGGVDAVEALNEAKAELLYRELDRSDFYRPTAHPDHRSITNVTFRLADEALTPRFVSEAEQHGLLALAGHATVGGLRASIYNGMPIEGVQALVEFMGEFERTAG